MKSGCIDCKTRYPACHDECEIYKAWKEEHLENVRKRNKAKYGDYQMMGLMRDRKIKREKKDLHDKR